MSTEQRIHLYGPSRQRVGYEDQEWAVWILGQDDIHEQPSLAEALEFAAENNSIFADLRLSASEFDPVCYAVVLHHGYAWNATVEHQLGRDCGRPDCQACETSRTESKPPTRCTCGVGPYTLDGRCETCTEAAA